MSTRILGGIGISLDDCEHWQFELPGGTTVVHLNEVALHFGPDASPEGIRKLAATLHELAEARAEIARLRGEQDGAETGGADCGHPRTEPCGHDDYHNPHPWADHEHVWCPGHTAEGEMGGAR
ncbi:hypothetical protein GCM10023347_33770 [Streptomyces chumphonensis]|uniref:Uncharacterized protein n=1 Tax=Streptomyces chumphonensis TaxID=1214925 RepID=A0A927EYC0_9ACTN|nr:hypothetical protein [Streptomyces chumphonensis]MBD3931953.1 hypothetical protein [Streptomyces chumphonensis]